jgi:hypothetical protein
VTEENPLITESGNESKIVVADEGIPSSSCFVNVFMIGSPRSCLTGGVPSDL